MLVSTFVSIAGAKGSENRPLFGVPPDDIDPIMCAAAGMTFQAYIFTVASCCAAQLFGRSIAAPGYIFMKIVSIVALAMTTYSISFNYQSAWSHLLFSASVAVAEILWENIPKRFANEDVRVDIKEDCRIILLFPYKLIRGIIKAIPKAMDESIEGSRVTQRGDEKKTRATRSSDTASATPH